MLHRRLIHTLAVAAAACVLIAPTASARPDYPMPAGSGSAGASPAAVETVRVPGPTVVVEAAESSGFDWGSAAVGAAAAAAIVLLAGAAATTTVRHRRMAA